VKGQYYANATNDFWKLIGAALNQHLDGLTYESKLEMLKAHGIGLWDTIATSRSAACPKSGFSFSGLQLEQGQTFARSYP
jgi:G:T/U-mismatch repair DNA glycosylase